MRDWELVLYKYANVSVPDCRSAPLEGGSRHLTFYTGPGSISPGYSHFCSFRFVLFFFDILPLYFAMIAANFGPFRIDPTRTIPKTV